jgi:uncharacterized membrane protein (DUF485 family)
MTWIDAPAKGEMLRERIVFGIMVLVLLFLFTFVFLVLGKGDYEPPSSGQNAVESSVELA